MRRSEARAAASDRSAWPSARALVRCAPISRVAPGVHVRRVAEHVPAAWRVVDPDAVLAARVRGVDAGLRALLGSDVESPELAEAAGLARRAAEVAVTAGRPLAAANAELPWPDAPHLVLWHAATILREHRGDGHIAALLTRRPRPDRGVGLVRRRRGRPARGLRQPGLDRR